MCQFNVGKKNRVICEIPGIILTTKTEEEASHILHAVGIQVKCFDYIVLFNLVCGFLSISKTLLYCLVVSDWFRYDRVIVNGGLTVRASAKHYDKSCPCWYLMFRKAALLPKQDPQNVLHMSFWESIVTARTCYLLHFNLRTLALRVVTIGKYIWCSKV